MASGSDAGQAAGLDPVLHRAALVVPPDYVRRGAGAYVVSRTDGGDATEERIEPRRLPGS